MRRLPRRATPALASALLLVVAACGGGAEGEEIVRGFHGYPWGTTAEQIPELAGTPPSGEKDGLRVHAAEVPFLGHAMLAGFYFHPRTGGLVEGYYVMRLDLEACEREWARVVADLAAAHPAAERDEVVAVRPAADSARYVSDCEYFLYRGDLEEWRVWFENPAPPHDRAGAWLDVVGRTLRLTVAYQGGESRRWADRFRWPFRWPFGAPERPDAPPGPPTQQPPPGVEGLPFGRA